VVQHHRAPGQLLTSGFANEETGPAEKGRDAAVMTIICHVAREAHNNLSFILPSREKPIVICLLFFRHTFGKVIVSEVSMRPAHRTALLFAVITNDRNKV
jgi:hypothetical protein